LRVKPAKLALRTFGWRALGKRFLHHAPCGKTRKRGIQ
jgi:hypothetical protein